MPSTMEFQQALLGWASQSVYAYLVNATPTFNTTQAQLGPQELPVGNGYPAQRVQVHAPGVQTNNEISRTGFSVATWQAVGGPIGPFTHVCYVRNGVAARGSGQGQLMYWAQVHGAPRTLQPGESYSHQLPTITLFTNG
jgi:hypothetical protein